MAYKGNDPSLLHGLLHALGEIPSATAILEDLELPGPDGRIDAVIAMELRGQNLLLPVEMKREIFPRDVHHAVFQVRRYARHLHIADHEVVPLIAAHSISQGARELLIETEVGFYDLGGSLFLPAKAAYILIDRPIPKKAAKIFSSIFEGQKGRVIQAAFERRPRWLSVKELADAAGVAASTASTTLAELERRDWATAEGAGPAKMRRLVNERAMLDEWTSYVRGKKPPKIERYFVPVGSVPELAHRLEAACKRHGARYAITGEVAAQVDAPYLSNVSQLRCRIEPGPARWHALEELGARPVSEGWNLGVIKTGSADEIQVMDQDIGLSLAPPIQVYLDLLQGSGRSKEMAEHYRHERLDR